eukprot:CAMPEP_0181328694 /NCGR_PEP_ID=MMETSP1101-20121128/22875_1 /TAXON_ID=46948 /ORGANISM="Rhodomonas abbreviata, Strain Caron Lab Isolate" /LENGTH=316 /DNA_ID=CAMNT_0023437645 /DNA_START=6 /DNA_END=953 /DNA_ORIENTATION=-
MPACRAAVHRSTGGSMSAFLQATIVVVVFASCVHAFVPIGLRIPHGSPVSSSTVSLKLRARAAFSHARASSIRMSPDMLHAEPEGSVEETVEPLAPPPGLAGPPKRPTEPEPVKEVVQTPVAAAPAVATPQSPAPAAASVDTMPAPKWAQEKEGTTPSAVHVTRCGKCRAQYVMDLTVLGDEGRKVQCAVCKNEWFQATAKLDELEAGIEFKAYPVEDYKPGEGGGGGGRRGNNGAITLFVGNLPFTLTEDTLRNVFSAYGEVVSASIIMDAETGRPRGFGFVDFADEEAGKAAKDGVNGMTVEGRELAVNISEDK